jgi:ABC-type polysaccharide/polyol phosphate export permease
LNWSFVWLYALSQIRLRYRHTFLGLLWNIAEPALYLGVLGIVFSGLNRMALGDYVVYLFAALVPWRYIETASVSTMQSIVGGEWLLKTMSVSPFVFPLSKWLVATIDFCFAYAVALAILGIIKVEWTVHVLIIPLSIALSGMAALGMGMLLAVVYTFFRDVKPLVTMGLMLAFFSGPILYKADGLPKGSVLAMVLPYNPLTYFSAIFQKPLYYMRWPDPIDWIVTGVAAITLLSLGLITIHHYRNRFYFYL